MEQVSIVHLRCIRENGKLRVRITSPGYNHCANCQFPRNIRCEGRAYTVPVGNITFTKNSSYKFFYRVRKDNIKILDETNQGEVEQGEEQRDLTEFKIYGDNEDPDCCICLDNAKDSAFYPCGHYYCCGTCANTLLIQRMTCPICRAQIQQVIGKEQFQ